MKGMMINIEDLMGGGEAAVSLPHQPAEPILEARLEGLRELQKLYSQPCPFKVGDLVTPRSTSPLRHVGKPHIVVEIFETPVRKFNGDGGMSDFGGRYDMRVLGFNDAMSICPWSAESWMYEDWTPEMDEARRG